MKKWILTLLTIMGMSAPAYATTNYCPGVLAQATMADLLKALPSQSNTCTLATGLTMTGPMTFLSGVAPNGRGGVRPSDVTIAFNYNLTTPPTINWTVRCPTCTTKSGQASTYNWGAFYTGTLTNPGFNVLAAGDSKSESKPPAPTCLPNYSAVLTLGTGAGNVNLPAVEGWANTDPNPYLPDTMTVSNYLIEFTQSTANFACSYSFSRDYQLFLSQPTPLN